MRELIIQNLNKNSGKIIYISGELISTKLDKSLIQEGYVLKRVINYKVNQAKIYDENFVKELKLNMPDIVYLYSQNSEIQWMSFEESMSAFQTTPKEIFIDVCGS